MNSPTSYDLDPVWLRAAMLGSIWASAEVLLGSFLHNLGFPFTGTLLAAIGTALVVAGAGVWEGRGLIWRSGLVCALMKSVSPSAVILGPMVGILAEAALLEAAVRIVGRNPVGYSVGGMLAVATPLVQKLVNLVIVYGWDLTRLYVGVFEAGARFLGITSLGPVDALLIVLILHAMAGIAAAILGIVAGRRVGTVPAQQFTLQEFDERFRPESAGGQRYSLILLLVNIMVICGSLASVGSIPLWGIAMATLAYGSVVWVLYPAARKRLSRWRLWVEIVAVSVLAGILLGDLPHARSGFSGAAAGLQMALRAVLMISAFNAISVELRNPVVIDWFLRRGMGKLAAALDVAFEALPFMIRTLGEQRRFLREPIHSMVRLLAAGRDWLAASTNLQRHTVYILSGDRGSGKTRLLTAIVETLLLAGKRVGGILSPAVFDQESRLGYDVLDIQTGRQMLLCRRDIAPTGGEAGPFRFAIDAVRFGNSALEQAAADRVDLIIIDELGPLEFDGRGWNSGLAKILESFHGSLLLVVRPNLVGRLSERWPLSPARTWDARETDKDTLTRELLTLLRRRRPRPPAS